MSNSRQPPNLPDKLCPDPDRKCQVFWSEALQKPMCRLCIQQEVFDIGQTFETEVGSRTLDFLFHSLVHPLPTAATEPHVEKFRAGQRSAILQIKQNVDLYREVTDGRSQ